MTKSFTKIITKKEGGSSAKFEDEQIKTSTVTQALRRKEFKRFTSNVTYMVNCGLGLLAYVAAGVILLIKADALKIFMIMIQDSNPMIYSAMPVLVTFAICLLASMTEIAAPAISLEGKNIWILQTMPVDPYMIFSAKIYVHVSLALVPALFCSFAATVAFSITGMTQVMVVICTLVYNVFSAYAQLGLDLRRPFLNWTSEIQPIKQSINILIAIFGGWGLSAALGFLYLLLNKFVGADVYLIIMTIVFVVLVRLIQKWMKTTGRVIFAKL